MYPKDNIFNIYYNIGRRVPFIVKRIHGGASAAPDYFHNKQGRTFLVEKVKPGGLGGKYGHAYGKAFVNGEPNDEYREQCYPDIKDEEIPCAGCGEWVLIEVPGFTMDEIFPPQKANDIVPFGMYKGKTYGEVANFDKKYIFWLIEKKDVKIDLYDVFGIDTKDERAKEQLNAIIDDVFPKIKVDEVITFGKYKGITWREVYSQNPEYIMWVMRNQQDKYFDMDDFKQLFNNLKDLTE